MNARHWIIVALCFISPSAFAEWKSMGTFGDSVVYFETDTIRGDLREPKFWLMYDFPKGRTFPSGKAYRSLKIRYLAKCEDETTAIQTYVAYSEHKGAGSVVASEVNRDDQLQWTPNVPQTIMQTIVDAFCNHAKK